MAVTRSSTGRRAPHKSAPQHRHTYYSTPVKNQLIGAARNASRLKDLYESEQIASRTAREWRKRYREDGSPSLRRTRRPGRPPNISDESLSDLLDPEKNPVYGLSYEEQIHINRLPLSQARTLRRNLVAREHAHRFKRAKVSLLTNKQKAARVQFGQDYQHETVWSRWQFVHFTDEVHFEATEVPRDYVLRREGTRYEPENVQQMPDKGGVDLHCAALISWWHKGPIEFYNDEQDEAPNEASTQPAYPPKPRRRPKTENEEGYTKRLTEWEANKPHDVEIKKRAIP